MTESDFEHFRQLGEDVGIEFKRGGNGAQTDTFETICAFLNRFGGELFLGVENDGTVIGVPDGAVEPMMRHIVKVASDPQLMDPPFYLQPDSFKIGGRNVVHVRVPPSSDVHRFKGFVFDRCHEADVRVRETEAIAQLYIRKQEIYTERRVYPGIRKADLRLDLVSVVKEMAATFRPDHPWRKLGTDTFFKSARLYGRDAATGKEGFNAAGILLFGKDDTILDVFPVYRTDAILRRVNIDRYDDRDTVCTNLIESFSRLMAFGEKHLSDKLARRPEPSQSPRKDSPRSHLQQSRAPRVFQFQTGQTCDRKRLSLGGQRKPRCVPRPHYAGKRPAGSEKSDSRIILQADWQRR